jgi:glycosyltransferase involved in cell wall biosynthesis
MKKQQSVDLARPLDRVVVNKKILYFVTEDWYFCSHRLPLAVAAKKAGYDVAVVTRVREHGERIESFGIRLIPLELSRRGTNPWTEWRLFRKLCAIYHREKPDLVHHVALKPVLYGTLAARLAGIPRVVNALAGLGYLFASTRSRAKLLRLVVQIAFRWLLNTRKGRVILQNPDDVRALIAAKALRPGHGVLIRGSGVDLDLFRPRAESDEIPIVVLASRMLWNKGIGEFVKAAEILRREDVQARFALVGDTDEENPAAIPSAQLEDWAASGIIEWWGKRNDMPETLARAHVVCLPSYYGEGVPKILLEAAAAGRAIVTTDMPGCREVVSHGENGLRVPARDPHALAGALKTLIGDRLLRERMGERGREIVETEFGVEKVVSATLAVYQTLLA